MKPLITILMAMLSVFAPVQAVMLTVLVMVLADLASGVLAAYKRGEKITSLGLQRTTVKILKYEFVIMAAFLCDHYLTGTAIFVKAFAGFVGMTELYSIVENFNSVKSDPALQSILDKITPFLIKAVKTDDSKSDPKK
jgi:phage-related holin